MLVGTLLGDGHLKVNPSREKAVLVILQSAEHKEYVFHLYEIFKEFVSTPPRLSYFTDKRTPGRKYGRYQFRTRLFECFMPYANLFYPVTIESIVENENALTSDIPNIADEKNKKCVPKTIGNILTARGVAYWYMDDGAAKWIKKTQAMRLCTDSFSKEDVMLLISVLKENFNIDAKWFGERANPTAKIKNRINLPAASYPRFDAIVAPYFHASMLYKYPAPKQQKFSPNKNKTKD